ncbi:Dysferlin-interacting protein 1 [Intoshia linei]|uniref:Dysferlin-interacting protein 1 n=1 Tax=Intoshia linei TaxID=1819745 RepID=A0A177BBJ6_9BILA|nr:Dysferlin-interacting protein 1 [Intoshia linei]
MSNFQMEGTHQKRKEQINRWTSSVYKGKSDIAKPSHEKAIHFPDSVILFNSCVNYNIDEVKQLLDSGIDINSAINEHGLTAMHQACIDGNLEMVKFLVDNGADINRVDAESWTVLHAAAYSGNIKICEYLIEQGVNLEKITVDSKLAMDTTENSEIINLISCAMIKKNLDPQKCRNAEQQRMMNDIKKWICHNPKNVNKPISEGNITALHIAAAKGFVDIMKYLMELGADPNVVDVDMWTPLHAAAYSDKLEAVVFLCSLDNCNIDALTNDVILFSMLIYAYY